MTFAVNPRVPARDVRAGEAFLYPHFLITLSSQPKHWLLPRVSHPPPRPALMARRARVAGDIQVVDSVIETAKLGGLEPSFHSVPALVFRAGGGDVGVRIIP